MNELQICTAMITFIHHFYDILHIAINMYHIFNCLQWYHNTETTSAMTVANISSIMKSLESVFNFLITNENKL